MNTVLRTEIAKITTYEEMDELITVVKAQQRLVRQSKSQNVKATLYVGATVSIDNSDHLGNKTVETGEIVKINRTRAVVKIGEDMYNCPFGMISVKTDATPKSDRDEALEALETLKQFNDGV